MFPGFVVATCLFGYDLDLLPSRTCSFKHPPNEAIIP
jgi:hypothetical protein